MVFDTTTKQRTYAFFVLQEMDLQHEWCAYDVLYVFAHTFWSFQLISLFSDFFSEVPDNLLQQVHQQEAWPDNRMYACYPVHRLADLPCRLPLPSTSTHWDCQYMKCSSFHCCQKRKSSIVISSTMILPMRFSSVFTAVPVLLPEVPDWKTVL